MDDRQEFYDHVSIGDDEVTALDEDPVDGLGELPDCEDDPQWCRIVGPADAGGDE